MRILVMVMSCNKHSHLWDEIINRRRKDTYIFTGGSDNTYMDKKNHVLHLKCNDAYDGLPEKVITMIDYVLHNNHFSDVTHILKVDDHDTGFNKENIKNLYKIPDIQYGHYIGQKVNRLVYEKKHDSKYHFGKVDQKSYWHNKPYVITDDLTWVDGGCSYILSRKASEIINNDCNPYLFYANKIYESEIYEDVMIGKILCKNGLYPKKVNYGFIGDK